MYVCYSCKSTGIPKFIPNKLSTYEETFFNTLDPEGYHDVVFEEPYIAPICINLASTSIEGFVKDGRINNCALYYLVQANVYGCFRCANGYNGRVAKNTGLGYIEHCSKYDRCQTNKNFTGSSLYNLEYS